MRTRKYARFKILESKNFLKTIGEVDEMFPGKVWVLIGGLAVAYYANPPVTVDVDVVFDDTLYSSDELIREMKDAGWRYRPLHFPHRQKGLPRRGAAFERGHKNSTIIDFIFTGKDKFLRQVVSDSQLSKLSNGLEIPIISPENLIVMKSLVGRDKDTDDTADLYRALEKTLDFDYIQQTLERLE